MSTSAPLPFDPADLAQGVRVNQADFARMCGVSRQTVSQWVKLGKIKHTYPDGTLDPARAAREVIRNTDPARLRAKVFKVANEDAQALRARVAELERKLTAAQALRARISELERKLNAAEGYYYNLIQALADIGVPFPHLCYLEWLAETDRRHTDTEYTEYMDYLAGGRHTDTEEEDDEIEALKLEGLRFEELPLFKQAAGSDETSEPSEAQSDGEQWEQGERKPEP